MSTAKQGAFQFKYSNISYNIIVKLYTDPDEDGDYLEAALDINFLEEVMYESELNDLIMYGRILYTDKYAFIDRFKNFQYRYCDITFAQSTTKTDGQNGMNALDKKNMFNHTFIVDNILQIDRHGNAIKYMIELKSDNWYWCASNLMYSNNDKSPQPVLDIIKDCIASTGQSVDHKTFKEVKTDVKLNYISQVNDNLMTAVDYLLHKLYFRKKKDDTLKFISYDWYYKDYRLLDLTKMSTACGKTTTTFSFFKTNNEMLIQQEPTTFGSFECPIPKTDSYKNLFNKNLYSFDFASGSFINNKIKGESIANYMNSMDYSNDYKPMYSEMFSIDGLKFFQSGAYWNTDFDIYNTSVESLWQIDSFAVNITGVIRRQPGGMLMVAIDRSMKNVTSDSKVEFEKIKKMYKTYEGTWFISKVTNIIRPQESTFRQQLALFRNFIPKKKKASSAITIT